MTAIELDFGPELAPAGGSRHLASENEPELLTEYFSTAVRLVLGGAVVFSTELPLLNFVDMVALSADAAASGNPVRVSPEFGGAGTWSVEPERDRVKVEYSCFSQEEERYVTGSVSAGRGEFASALGAFALRALEAAERADSAVAQNPWTRRTRQRMRAVLAETMDGSIVTMTTADGTENEDTAAMLACRVWSYGGPPDAVPAPIEVEVLADPEAGGTEVTVEVTGGRPRVDVITRPETASDPGALADAVWPGIGEVFGVYGATAHPLYRATRPV